MSNTKPTRNTDLIKAIIPGLPDYSSARATYEMCCERLPCRRPGDIANAFKRNSPLRTHGDVHDFGWASFQVTADDRSYTVVVLADSANEWEPEGSHRFLEFIASLMHTSTAS